MLIFYLHSEGADEIGQSFDWHSADDVRHIVIPDATRADDVFSHAFRGFKREEQAKPFGIIDLLVIISDGGPGFLKLCGGHGDEQHIVVGNAEAFAGQFQRFLKPPQLGGRGVEIYGCSVAAPKMMIGRIGEVTDEIEDENFGYRFVAKLAKGFNNIVTASAGSRYSIYDSVYEDTSHQGVPDAIKVDPDSDPEHAEGLPVVMPTNLSDHSENIAAMIRADFQQSPLLTPLRHTPPAGFPLPDLERGVW